jgi:hypothetical protein
VYAGIGHDHARRMAKVASIGVVLQAVEADVEEDSMGGYDGWFDPRDQYDPGDE